MKLDVHNRKPQYENWREEVESVGISGLNASNSDLVVQYIFDMERGENVARSSKKGKRSYAQLNKLRQKLTLTLKRLQERGGKDVRTTTSTQILSLFADIENGKIRRNDGKEYGDISTDVKVFKAFWHWWMKVNRKEGKTILDITEDLNAAPSQAPKFVYLKRGELDEMLPYFEKKEQTILLFVYDSLIRSPTELMSLKVKDIYQEDGETWVDIPTEISKVRGRTFNLLFSGKAVIDHIKENKLNPSDHLFSFSPEYLNWKMQKVAAQLWEDKISSKAGEMYRKITLYDLRHSGAIHLRILAKENPGEISLDAIRERGGWSDFKMLNYYTKFIGIDGKIDKQGLLIKKDKTKLEEDIETLKNQKSVSEDKFKHMAREIRQLKEILSQLAEGKTS